MSGDAGEMRFRSRDFSTIDAESLVAYWPKAEFFCHFV